MGIYQGLLELKKGNALLDFRDLSDRKGKACLMLSNQSDTKYEIHIERSLSPFGKAREIIHEAFHVTPKFSSYLGQRLGSNHPIEQEINQLVNIVASCQPILMNYLIKKCNNK